MLTLLAGCLLLTTPPDDRVDGDGDGLTRDVDCDDTDGDIGMPGTWFADADGDGYGDVATTTGACEQPAGHVSDSTDCDDTDATASPGTAEVCDEVDNDCDGTVDEGVTTTFYADTDGDGYGDASSTIAACAAPDGYADSSDDCDDDAEQANPDAAEVCDGIDNDCDGEVDEDAVDAGTWYADTDGDGYGDASSTIASCEQPAGHVAGGTDCDDTDSRLHPGAEESDCTDPTDYNCDGSVGYADADGDGWAACQECDDGDAAISPEATEVCDEVDNDCDGETNEGVTTTYYQDSDGDSYGVTDTTTEACDLPDGYAEAPGDCDDDEAQANPGESEVCDDIDNDCDGLTDDDDDSLDTTTAETFYADSDGDGYGNPGAATLACEQPDGYADNSDDCDDDEAAASPGEAEVCDEIDNDCDGSVDEGVTTTFYADADGDFYGDAASTAEACSRPAGYRTNDLDCDDTDADINPGEAEVCDEADNDCDGSVDEGVTTTFYADADGDGYGDADSSEEACEAPSGYVEAGDDCDDTNANILDFCDCTDDSFDETYDDVDGDGIADGVADKVVVTGDDEICFHKDLIDWSGTVYVIGYGFGGDNDWTETDNPTTPSGDYHCLVFEELKTAHYRVNLADSTLTDWGLLDDYCGDCIDHEPLCWENTKEQGLGYSICFEWSGGAIVEKADCSNDK